SRERSSVGRASASLICTWTTAAPAAWHSFAVVTSSSRVTGSAGTADFSDSAPVGATVIRVAAPDGLLLMIRACLLSPARVHPGTNTSRFPAVGRAWRRRHAGGRDWVPAGVAAGEGGRLGEVTDPGLPGDGPAGVDLEHHDAGVAVRGELLQQRRARLGAAAGDQVLVPVGHPRPVGHVHVDEPVAELLGH